MQCPVCGTTCTDDQLFCALCGTRLTTTPDPQAVGGNGATIPADQQASAQQAAQYAPAQQAANPAFGQQMQTQTPQVAPYAPAQQMTGQQTAAYAAGQQMAMPNQQVSPYATNQQTPWNAAGPQAAPQSAVPPTTANAKTSKLPDLPYNVVGLICAALVIIAGLLTRIINSFVFSSPYLYNSPFDYFISSITLATVVYWAGLIVMGVGSITKNRIVIGVGAIIVGLETAWNLITRMGNFSNGNISNLASYTISTLCIIVSLAGIVVLIVLAFSANGEKAQPTLQLIPAALLVVSCLLSLVSSIVGGPMFVYLIMNLISNLALAALALSCAVVANE